MTAGALGQGRDVCRRSWTICKLPSQEAGIHGLRRAYREVERRNLARRALFRAVDLVFPLSRFLDAAVLLDDRIRELGAPEGCRAALNEFGFPWEVSMPQGQAVVLRESPLVAYGNHPTLLSAFLVAAGLSRPDLRFLSLEYVSRLLPSLTPYLLPLKVTYDRQTRPRLGVDFGHRVGLALLYRMEPEAPADVAREQNRESITAAVSHVQAGGCVVVFPSGGGPGRWFSGIGFLIRGLLDADPESRAVLVPFQEQNSSNRLTYSIVSHRWPVAARMARRRGPIRLVFEKPIAVASVLADPSAHDLTRLLEGRYDRLFKDDSSRETRETGSR